MTRKEKADRRKKMRQLKRQSRHVQALHTPAWGSRKRSFTVEEARKWLQ